MTRLRLRLDGQLHDVELGRDGDARVVTVDGTELRVDRVFEAGEGRSIEVEVGGRRHVVHRRDLETIVIDGQESTFRIESVAAGAGGGVIGAEGAEVRPPMPGKVIAVRVSKGEPVEAGQVLVVLEAMKMQNEITSPAAGVVLTVPAATGAIVDVTDVLVTLGPASGREAKQVMA